ncbi:MAG: DUF3142 domain-containing protein [Candidatus Omnitrophica bacterium]|nr:DUF3142 domain-containing protein [Candidatus Omnitrophota bacterium]
MQVGLKIIFTIVFVLSVCNLSGADENSVYIWQRSWRSEIEAAIGKLNSQSTQFKVLAGDLTVENGHISFSKVAVKWEYLRSKKKTVIDIRMRTDLSRYLKVQDQQPIVRCLVDGIHGIIEQAKQSGVDITGIELDYDCPTAKLNDFARFLKLFRSAYKEKSVSITALPTWLESKDFLSLLNWVDIYVLQLHSFELPKNKNTSQYIFQKDKSIEYFNRTINLNKPFYVSLPTYGYEVAYSKVDEFIGLRAEGGVQYFAEGIKKKMVFADPQEIIGFLKYLDSVKSQNFRGVCWFRLPLSSDRFNWDLKTFTRVIKREIPAGHLDVELVRKDDGITEVYLVNDGEINFSNNASFEIFWDTGSPVFDVLGDFDYSTLPDGKGMRITGRPPRVSQKKMAAWFRVSDNKDLFIRKSEAKVDETN